ncbi:hypothetical protein GCM10011316_06240 [Roseibium aquae]|uniref:AsmA domain-containing protein n=1 Tax=Roseibium aquae TaxID=1323746 RepID=A0A916T9I4_9HYPH|nr:AsmA-like C-terminal region-containing protein [Roseibium aquae]GGB36859.1 hypothetical protein GCM10011316_06240 [Roseibium aquae]
MAIILVLVTALVGPFFVDWTVYRSTFETYAERVVGHKVTVLGDADLRLLPAPSITFSDVRVGEAEDPLLVVSQFQMRIELPPLMKGEFRVQDLKLEQPRLRLSLDEEGRLDWLTAQTSDGMLARLAPDDVSFENVTVSGGSLAIVDARSGQTIEIDSGNLALSARSLAGPFRLDGTLTHGRAPYTVSLASGRLLPEGGIRVKGSVTPAAVPVDLSFDGKLHHADAAPYYEGVFDLTSIVLEDAPESSWQISGAFTADVERVDVPEFEYVLGPEDRRLSASGTAELIYAGDRRFEVRARTKQLDLDRMLGGGPQAPVRLGSASGTLMELFRKVPRPDMNGVISLDVPAVVLGGALVQDVRVDLETMLGGWRLARLAGRAPGRTLIATQGDLGLATDLTYRGRLSFNSAQPGVFLDWLAPFEGQIPRLDPLEFDGRLNIIPGGMSLDGLRLALADAEARGELSYRIRPNLADMFSLQLSADRLDLDVLSDLAGAVRQVHHGALDAPANTAKGPDIELRINANEIAAGGIVGEGMAIEAQYADGDLTIDRLYTADLAGAEIDAQGRIEDLFGAPEGEMRGALAAQDLTGLVQLLENVVPDMTGLASLKNAAPHLVPARLSAVLTARAQDGQSDVSLEFQGTAADSRVQLSAGLDGHVDDWRHAQTAVDLSMSAGDGGALLRQLGFALLPVDDLGPGDISLQVGGRPGDALQVSFSAKAPAAEIAASGTIRLEEGADPAFDLDISAQTVDLTPIGLMFGRVLPVMGGEIPGSFSAQVHGTGSVLEKAVWTGSIAGVDVSGEISGDFQPSPGANDRRLSGTVSLDAVDLRVLSEAVLGPDQWFATGDGSSIWPNGAFGAPLLNSFDLTLDLSAGSLTAGEGFALSNVTAGLRLTPDRMRLDRISGTFETGTASGALSIERSGPEAAVSGRLQLQDADFRRLSWQRDGRATGTGLLDLFLEFEGAGRSIAGIISTLNGGGTFSLSDGTLRGLNPQAFDLVVRAVDAGLELEDSQIETAFVSHLDAGQLTFDRLEGAVGLVGGRLTARNVAVDAEAAEVFGSAEVDLNTFELDSDFSVRVDPGENAVTGAEPQVGLLFQGPVDRPDRRIDISPFTAYLTLRAFEQEVERVERLQAEILERDRLLRELRRLREERARAERDAEAAAREGADQNAGEDGEAANGAENEEAATGTDAAEPEANERASAGDARAPAAQVPARPLERELEAEQALDIPDNAAFARSIRSILETGAAGTGSQPLPPSASGSPAGGSDLPPLDAPRTIEDLIDSSGSRPIITPDFGAEPATRAGGANERPAEAPVSGQRDRAPENPRSSVPRYITLPSGLVMENPDWPG